MSDDDWAARFDETFAGPPSRVQARAWQEVLGDEHLPSLDTYSYVTRSELHRIADELRLERGQVLVDIGCGRGGPGLWVAARTGARIIGLDIAQSALDAAHERALGLGLGDRAELQLGSFESTGLATGSVDAVMSVDALLFTPDKAAAARELARILKPGGRLVLTTWDYHRQPVGRPPQVPDHRPLLADAGFDVEAYEDTPLWREHQDRTTQLLLDSVDELAAESAADPEELRASLEEMRASAECMIRRVLIVARRRPD